MEEQQVNHTALNFENNRLSYCGLDCQKIPPTLSKMYGDKVKCLDLRYFQICNLEALVDTIGKSFPSITYLSLLSNKACPNQLSDIDKDDSDYQRYRYFVIHVLPKLKFLDSCRVTSEERYQATLRGQFMRVRRPRSDVTDGNMAISLPVRGPPARALPVDFGALGKHKGAYGKCSYKYTGKHSEGNRFILNSDL